MFEVREADASRPTGSFLPLPLPTALIPLSLRIEDGYGWVHNVPARNTYKRFRRFFFRYLYKNISLFNSKELACITDKHKSILWMHFSEPYIGDSLMDLSSRVLLKNRNIDLLTEKNISSLYENDSIFNSIFTNIKKCDIRKYDLIIIDAYRQRTLKVIKKHVVKIPFVTMCGYYHGPNFNRTLFSFFRMNQLLSYPYDEKDINMMATPLISISAHNKEIIDKIGLPDVFITIAIGGRDHKRTFNRWSDVIRKIIYAHPNIKIALIGNNSKEEVQNIRNKYPDNIINLVAQYSFNQTAQIIKKSQLLLCCDGGLMHAANATNTPIIALFCHVMPKTRTTATNKSYVLYNKNDVNYIATDDIINKFKLLIGSINNEQ